MRCYPALMWTHSSPAFLWMKWCRLSRRGCRMMRHWRTEPPFPQTRWQIYRIVLKVQLLHLWRNILRTTGRSGKHLYRVLRRAGHGVSTCKTPNVEAVCWWHMLHHLERNSRKTPRTPKWNTTQHTIYCGTGEGYSSSLPWHPTTKEWMQ